MKRLLITHTTGYRYEELVSASYNEARMLPYGDAGQVVLSSTISISPTATENIYLDYWGSRVCSFEILHPHRELILQAESLVEVENRNQSNFRGPDFAQIQELSRNLLEVAEQLIPTVRTQLPGPLADFVTELKSTANLSPHEMALAIVNYVRSQIEYLPGSTEVNTTSLEAWEAKSGVCQDIAHITLAGLRFAGIPARYVSGYLHPDPDAKIGEDVTGESHAWVEWYGGEWYGFDPTNLIPISDRHVLISRGRDYSDVPPIKGVYAGNGQSQLFVQVTIVRQQ